MTDHDDEMSRRYRELPREEPPAALDASILAAARNAVRPRARNRWLGPVSIAAVLVLGIGVSLRMQLEQPDVETAAPAASGSAEYPVPQAAEDAPPTAEQAAPAAKAPAKREERAAAKPPARVERKELAPSPPAAAPVEPMPFAQAPAAAPPPPVPQADAPPMQAATAPQPRAQSKLGMTAESVAPLRAKRADSAAATDTATPAKDPREVELERIARLRAEGNHAEADKALEEFRRRNPDYRIAEPMWERIRPR
jgi:hypothetical protein